MKTQIEIDGVTYTIELGADGGTPEVIVLQGTGGGAIAGLEWAETMPPQLVSWRKATPFEIRTADRIAYARPVQTSRDVTIADPKVCAVPGPRGLRCALVAGHDGSHAGPPRPVTDPSVLIRWIASAVASLPVTRPEVSLGCWLREEDPGAAEAAALLRAHGAETRATYYAASNQQEARVITVYEAEIGGVTFRAQIAKYGDESVTVRL